MVFLTTFIIHAIRRLLATLGLIDTFASTQACVFLDFVLFLVPIIYVLNVHRKTFNVDA